MKNDMYEIKNQLDTLDLEVLHNIYLLRCLTVRQIYNNFYKDVIIHFNTFIDEKLNKMLKLNLVEEVEFNNDNIAIFLTKKGIEIVREEFDVPINIIDKKDKKIKRGYYTSSELKMLSRLIPHQIHLNQFVLDLKKAYEYKNLKMNLEYYDEKYVSQYINIRPDGLFRLLDTDFFLEMDMNSESQKQLKEKWQHYRAFLSSREYKEKDKKITVLFIIENTNNIENRKNIVKLTANEILLDLIDSDFEIIVGSKDEILLKLFNHIIPDMLKNNYYTKILKEILSSKHNFNISDGVKLKKQLNNAKYAYYIRKIDSNNNIIVENNRIQEYLLDYDYGDSLSIINKISYLEKNSAIFKYHFNREISYVVVCEDLDKMYLLLDILNLNFKNNVYYTTIERLNKFPFYQAICQFDKSGDKYCFTDSSLALKSYF